MSVPCSTWFLPHPALRTTAFILWRYVIRILVPCFTDVIFLSRIDPKMLAHPLNVLKPDVVVLAQRESDPVLGKQNALQIRMIRILHAEHVVHLALEPVGSAPDGGDTLDRFVFFDARFHSNVFILRVRIKDVYN